MNLIPRFGSAYPQFSSLPIQEAERGFTLGIPDSDSEIVLAQDEGGWTVHVSEAHAHFEVLDEAFDTIAGLLRSTVRTCREFRGETLSQTWLEYQADDGNYDVAHRAVYLDPFDSEDWVARSGETWRQVRLTRSFDPRLGISTSQFEVTADGPYGDERPHYQWLIDGLGIPMEGMRWVVSGQGRFVLQAPIGWRKAPNSDPQFDDYGPEEPGLVLRVVTYFRDSESPKPVIKGAATRSVNIEYEINDESEWWPEHHWNIFFNDGEEEMLAAIYLYFDPQRSDDAEVIKKRIEGAMPSFLKATDNWDCRTIA